jgi:hypothetical protein
MVSTEAKLVGVATNVLQLEGVHLSMHELYQFLDTIVTVPSGTPRPGTSDYTREVKIEQISYGFLDQEYSASVRVVGGALYLGWMSGYVMRVV